MYINTLYGIGERDEATEIRARYNALVNTFSDILGCGIWDIEEMFDSKNNIEVGEIIKRWITETGKLPTWNDVYREALFDFAFEKELEVGKDVDIYTNSCLDTHIYYRKGLDKTIVDELKDLFNLDAEEMED